MLESTKLTAGGLRLARGAIDEANDKTGFVNAERLFELTQENAGSHYFAKGGFRAWRDYG